MVGSVLVGGEPVATLDENGFWHSSDFDDGTLASVLDVSYHPVRNSEQYDHHLPFGVAVVARAALALGGEPEFDREILPYERLINRSNTKPTVNAVPSVKAEAEALYDVSDEYTKAEAREIARAVKIGYTRGHKVETVARELMRRTGIDHAQAVVVATTELTRVHAADVITDARRDGVGQLMFITGENSCDDCQALHGQIFDLSEADDIIPVHPNCTCRWQPVDNDQEETEDE